MKCFVYRYPEGALIQIPTDEFAVYDAVDPVEYIQQLAVEMGLKHARVTRTITVCVANETEDLFWSLNTMKVPPFMEYLAYP